MAEVDGRRWVPVAGPLLVLLFLGWTVIAPLVSLYNTGNRIADARRAARWPDVQRRDRSAALLRPRAGLALPPGRAEQDRGTNGVPEGVEVALRA